MTRWQKDQRVETSGKIGVQNLGGFGTFYRCFYKEKMRVGKQGFGIADLSHFVVKKRKDKERKNDEKMMNK